jgi:signal transduction histidine kinase/CheY-like chemotaxis protein
VSGNELLTLLIELLFALVFVRALVEYVRRRDSLSRDVTLVFTPLALLFVLDVVRRAIGPAPPAVSILATLLILAQPYLTLRLVAQIRLVPIAVLVGALAIYVLSAVPLVVWPRPVPPPVTLFAIAVFVVTEAVAAAYLAVEARRRTGSARARLATAAVATALFAIAVLAAGAAAAASTEAAAAANLMARITALLAGLGYLIAFVPPAWLRRMWEATAAYQYSQRLLQTPPTEEIRSIWGRFTAAAIEISGVDAAAVVVAEPEEQARVVASAGLLSRDESASCPPDELERLVNELPFERPLVEGGEIVSRLGEKATAGCFTVVPLRPPRQTRPAALLLFARHQTLFSEDDRALLAALGAQTVILTERRAILSEQERLASELAATVEALRAASQAKSDFVASMSHELRTPLNAIIGFSELMLAEPKRDQEIVVPFEWVEHIHSSGNHLLSLINDVLDLAKIEAGRLDLQPEPFDLATAVSESLAGLRPLAERKALRLESGVEPLAVVADRGRFRQILYNLLSNAIKFTREEGSVRVEARRSDGEVLVSVVDTGIGIAPEDQVHVFEEFRQVGERDQTQAGTGLGLALTRRLVEAHGGRIELESAAGEGSRFTVFLPQPEKPAVPAAPEPTPAAVPHAGLRERPEVLLVEDDPSAVRLLRTYLEADGYDVRVATTGEAGLEEARQRPPAAILLDILLPGMDGWEVLRRLKADDRLRDIPAIILTVVDERDVGLALGAVDYFLKPVDRQALLDRLSRYTFTAKVKQKKVRVLVVDDDAATRETVGAALRQEGFEVLTAAGGREAVQLARADAIDLILCDLIMPDLDGFEVVAALKSDAKTRETPILILTAHELTAAEKAALNGNIVGVVGKGQDAETGLRRWLASVVPRVGTASGGGNAG